MNLFNEIARVAYELYEKNGCIQNRDLDHWLEAEKIVMARLAEEQKIKSKKKPATKTKKSIKKKTK